MSTCTFAYGATSITIQTPKYPDEPGRSYPVVVGRTMGGGIKAADLGEAVVDQLVRLNFRGQSQDDYDDLWGFIQTTVVWGKYPFTFTDAYSTAHTNMRYVGGLESFKKTDGRWNGTLEIAKDLTL